MRDAGNMGLGILVGLSLAALALVFFAMHWEDTRLEEGCRALGGERVRGSESGFVYGHRSGNVWVCVKNGAPVRVR